MGIAERLVGIAVCPAGDEIAAVQRGIALVLPVEQHQRGGGLHPPRLAQCRAGNGKLRSFRQAGFPQRFGVGMRVVIGQLPQKRRFFLRQRQIGHGQLDDRHAACGQFAHKAHAVGDMGAVGVVAAAALLIGKRLGAVQQHALALGNQAVARLPQRVGIGGGLPLLVQDLIDHIAVEKGLPVEFIPVAVGVDRRAEAVAQGE